MFKYLKFSLAPLTVLISVYFATLGGNYMWYFFISFILLIMIGDILLGEDLSVEEYKNHNFLNAMLYLNLPLLVFLIIIMTFMIDNETVLGFIGYSITIGFMLGSFAVNVGHELTHRKNKKIDMFFGNWLQALCWDNAFSIEHVYGHHKNVGLHEDGATARRGEGIYTFMIRSTVHEYINAFNIEKARLLRKKKSIFNKENKFFIALSRSIFVSLLIFLIGGFKSLLCYLIAALISKILLETINYVEHYGLVREIGKPVKPRHSWNSNTFVSSAFTFYLTRHSAHHEKAHLPYWRLSPYSDAPKMPFGYLTTFFIALVFPFLYRKIMAKKLIEWDQTFASEGEKKIISQLGH